MDKTTLLERALALAALAHAGQKDKSGQPYILHPLRVMLRVKTEEDRAVAVLHDVLEDTAVPRKQLVDIGVTPAMLEALDCLTRRKNETYRTFIKRVSQNPMAIRVKLPDLEDNMDLSRTPEITSRDVRRNKKYRAAQRKLMGGNQASQERGPHE